MRARNLNDPNHWRDRAARMPSLASAATSQETFDLISDLADDYEKRPIDYSHNQMHPTDIYLRAIKRTGIAPVDVELGKEALPALSR
jgi:hypothetical protein